ncbi:MAG TPA: hypothetical protein VJ951_02410 [Bacteroidales bacterium]|nr:hypothetical protein [Bacteroidales bacterium]
MRRLIIIVFLLLATLHQCQETPEYPPEPFINYESFFLYISENSLEQEVLTGQLNFSFTDGDGNVGFDPLPDSLAIGKPDSLRYNLFLQVYDQQDNEFIKIPKDEGGYLKYNIPYLDKQPLSGTISVTIEYPIIRYDTIFYTFFLYDREFNKSNVDTTDVWILRDINDNDSTQTILGNFP